MRHDLIHQIELYQPFNAQEEADREVILSALKNTGDIFFRTNRTAHMTASAWVVNPDGGKILLAYHNIYDSWAWLGGHADGEEDLLSVAIREVKEESGISHVIPLQESVFSLEVLTVDGHVKKRSYVSSHLHLNLTYLLCADEREQPVSKPDENRAVAWFAREKAIEQSSEPWFRERIYSKLNQKLEEYLRTQK